LRSRILDPAIATAGGQVIFQDEKKKGLNYRANETSSRVRCVSDLIKEYSAV